MSEVAPVVAELEALALQLESSGLSAADVAVVKKRLRKLRRRDPDLWVRWWGRFASVLPERLHQEAAPPSPREAGYLPKSWPAARPSGRPGHPRAEPEPVTLGEAVFRERLDAWRPLELPLRDWFADCRRASAGDLEQRLAQLADCLWSCRELARHRRHVMGPRFSHHFDRIRDAERQLRARGRRGVKRALPVVEAIESELGEVLMALPGNLAPLSLPGPVAVSEVVRSGGGLRFIGQGASLGRWNALTGNTWVDLGCGEGASVAALARTRPAVDFVGVDIGPEPADWPSTARFVGLAEGDAAALHHQTAGLLSEASVVSLLYPIHREQSGELAVVHQVRTALQILEPGGQGVLVSEDPVAVRAAVDALVRDPRCGAVDVLDGCWSRDQLHALGIQPYRPTWSELTPSPAAVADQPAGSLDWGLVVFFVRDA